MNLVDQAFINAFSKTKATISLDRTVERKLRVDGSHAVHRRIGTESELTRSGPVPDPHFLSARPETEAWTDARPVLHQDAVAGTNVEEGSTIQPPHVAPPNDTSFRATWEVDSFHWPEVCRDLLMFHAGDFVPSIEQIAVRCRSGDRLLVVVGERIGVGCTTITLCLARKLVASGYSVAMVDADASQPELADRLGVETSISWLDVTWQKLSLKEAAVTALKDRVTLLPLGEKVSAGNLPDFRLAALQMMNELASHYDVVLVDAGSANMDSLGLFAAQRVSGINLLFVCDLSSTHDTPPRDEVSVVETTLPIIGVAENFVA